MGYKKEKTEHKKLLKMLSNHFRGDEDEMKEEDDEHNLHDQELFDRNGFGDPMDTFVVEGDTRQNHENDFDEDDDYDDNDNGDYDDGEEEDNEDTRAKKDDRKKMSIMMLSKKIGRSKSKKAM